MAKVGKNVLTRGLSGKLGNQVVFRNNGESTIISTAPGKRTRPLSEVQQLHVQLFREAVIYAKSVIADDAKKAVYEAAVKNGKSAFNLAIADFMKPPVISEMDNSNYTGQTGGKIRVRATDNFRITEINVTIFDPENMIVESGAATPQDNGLDYIYVATHVNNAMTGGRIVSKATDLPRHEVQMSQML